MVAILGNNDERYLKTSKGQVRYQSDKNFFFVVEPQVEDVIIEGEWEGSITSIKESLQKNQSELTKN